MLKLPASVQLYVAVDAADMRKQADGLSALVMKSLGQQPLSGNLFIFFNRRRDIIRILFWDNDGFWVLSKRLEAGRYRKLQVDTDQASVTVTAAEFGELLRAVRNPTTGKKILH
jgi:transposase